MTGGCRACEGGGKCAFGEGSGLVGQVKGGLEGGREVRGLEGETQAVAGVTFARRAFASGRNTRATRPAPGAPFVRSVRRRYSA
eukprot:102772-Prorocentrum_minimum.AAC.1